MQKKKDFKNVFINFFNFFMQNNKIIITFEIPIKKFNSGQMWNAINAALDFNHVPIVVAIVNKIVKNNIAITIMKNNVDELISNVNLWIFHLDFIINIIKSEFWHKIMTHGIPTNQDLSFLKNDIEKFNKEIVLINNPRWINSKMKKQCFILVLNITNQTELNIAKKGLNIFGMKTKTEVFVEKWWIFVCFVLFFLFFGFVSLVYGVFWSNFWHWTCIRGNLLHPKGVLKL